MTLHEADAQARLERMVASTSEPLLDGAAIAQLLNTSKLADDAGLAPTDADWTPTWDLNRGAAEGWRWKAASAAGKFTFTTDGQTFNRAEIIEHCERMALHYRRKINSNIILPGALATEA